MDVVECSLAQFLNQYREILHESYEVKAEFLLTGCLEGRQHAITALNTPYSPHNNNPTILRDYDSVLGFSDNIPINNDIFLYTLFNPTLTLTESIHLKVPFIMNANRPAVPFFPHKIPNVAIATFGGGTRGVIRMAFPALFNEDSTAQVPPEMKADIYNDGIMPTLREVVPEDAQNWPPTYQDSLFRSKNRGGTFQYGTRSLSQWEVADFSHTLKEKLSARHPWARDIVFITQIKGVKEAERHNPNVADAEAALGQFMGNVDVTSGTWFIDVGLEISEPGMAYQWTTEGHSVVLRQVLGIPEHTARRCTESTNRSYERDLSAHLLDLSGCRLQLIGPRRGPRNATYIQLYTTDKALVYHLEKGRHSKSMTGYEALEGTPKFTSELYKMFVNARNTVDCAARVEVRVPMAEATAVLLDLPEHILEQSLVVYPRRAWWSWKAVRVSAISSVFSLQNHAPVKARHSTSAMDLTVGLIWLLTGIYSKPDDGQVGREIMLRILPITADYGEGNLMFPPPANREVDLPVPHCPHGAVFLRSIKWPPECPSPRLEYRMEALSDRCYMAFFKCTFKELYNKRVQTGFQQRAENYVTMRKGITHPHRNEEPELIQAFEGLGVTIPDPYVDEGDDLPLEQVILPPPKEDTATTLTRLWFRFLTDILQKCGNEKRGTSYCKLTMEERESATMDTFQDVDLSKVFTKVQWRKASGEDTKKAFLFLWPSKNHVLAFSAQQFKQMQYYLEWKTLCSELPLNEVIKLQRALFAKFKELNWIPRPASDRVWAYAPDDSFHLLPSHLPLSTKAPQVLMLNQRAPVWGPDQDGMDGVGLEVGPVPPRQGLHREYQPRVMNDYISLRQEEEEDSDGN